MTKRLIIGTALALAVALCVGLFHLFFEPVTRKDWVGYRGEAARHRFLAAERFLDAHGITAVRARSLSAPDALAQHSVAIFSAGRQALTNSDIDRLLAWVQAGNHLILAPEAQAQDDPVLDRLKIQRAIVPPRNDTPSEREGENSAEANEATEATSSSPAGTAAGSRRGCGANEHVDEIALPGFTEKLNVNFGRQPPLMLDPNQAEYMWSGTRGIQMVSLRVGSGRVTVMPVEMFTNPRIGQFDHAALLLGLVTWERGMGSATFFDRMDGLSIWQWIIDNASLVAYATALLTLLWLWRAMVRFGPIAPDAPMANRSLIDHLAAAGRFQWRTGYRDHLVTAAREHAIGHATRLIPGFALLGATDQQGRLGALAGLSADESKLALTGQPRTPTEFITLANVLRRIHAARTQRGDPRRATME